MTVYLLFHDFGNGVAVGVVDPDGVVDVSLKLDGCSVQVGHELAQLRHLVRYFLRLVKTLVFPL